MSGKQPKICIVHDWLTNKGGAERVVAAFAEAFPGAPIYTSTYDPVSTDWFKDLDVRTTWLQKLPRPLRKLHKLFPTLRVKAFRALDLSEFDIILSSSSAEAKQVRKTREDQVHICYCHTPVRYYWSHYQEYKKNPSFGKLDPFVRLVIPLMVPRQRKLDYRAAQDVDVFIANSTEVKDRIKKYYHRDSIVLNPPVDTDRFAPYALGKNRGGLVAIGRQTPYKRFDLAIKAANQLGADLDVYGRGPEHNKLVALAGPTVKFYTGASDQEVAEAFGHASAFVFPTEEDFGIVQVEALAAGCPVVAYDKGGALDIVEDGKTGVLFDEQTVDSLVGAIERTGTIKWQPATLNRRARRFDKSLFITKIRKIVADSSKP
ncbi:MAG: glycosyltransferase [Candidatus Nomurabacteria bacterium]|nr:glycosyltransferase [Candidatus Nomurabacteria bacterium]